MSLARICTFAVTLILAAGAFAQQATTATAPAPAPAAAPRELPPRPFPAIERVLIISIDGLRPDVFFRADAPTIQSLYKQGTFTFWARTTPNSITLPSHTSMLTGVSPRIHGIEWNADLPLSKPVYPKVPTLFEIASKAGYVTAMAAGKSKFDTLAKPGTLTGEYITTDTKSTDADVAENAVLLIQSLKPHVMFVHFPGVDNVGHAIGWGTDEQLAAVKEADKAVASVLDCYKTQGLLRSTLIILSADHGGAGLNHGPDDSRSRHIPWICVGPGIRKNFDLARYADLQVNTEDTFATACYALGLKLGAYVEGRPVTRAFMLDELIAPAGK